MSPATTLVHRPVLLAEVIEGLNLRPGGDTIDATVGDGGHALAVLEATSPSGRLLGLDRDPRAVARARSALERFADRCTLLHASFADLGRTVADVGWSGVDAVLLDLGFSSVQVDDPARGFSFAADGPLDMRYDPATETTAESLVNGLTETELADLIYAYGEERQSRRLARAIVAARPVRSTVHLADVVQAAIGRRQRIHPATRTFQALRIAVNRELDAIEAALPQAVAVLRPRGRVAVISFQSLEDRIVKQFLRDAARDCVCPPGLGVCRCEHRATVRLVTKRAVRASEGETDRNPRARSARLRVAERLPGDAATERAP